MHHKSFTTSEQLQPPGCMGSVDMLRSRSSSHMNMLQLDITPEFWHFQYVILEFWDEFEMNIFINLLQPQTRIWNGVTLPTKDIDMGESEDEEENNNADIYNFYFGPSFYITSNIYATWFYWELT